MPRRTTIRPISRQSSTLLALAATPWLLAPAQALHALTFGAAHLGAIHFIARYAAPGQAATAQALYATLVGSLGLGSLMFVSGQLYERVAGGAFFAMALVSALGGLAVIALRRLERHKTRHD